MRPPLLSLSSPAVVFPEDDRDDDRLVAGVVGPVQVQFAGGVLTNADHSEAAAPGEGRGAVGADVSEQALDGPRITSDPRFPTISEQ